MITPDILSLVLTNSKTMKIAKLLFLGLLVFVSCSEDEDPMPTAAGLIGSWSVTDLEYEGTTTTTVTGISLTADFTGVGKDFDLTVTFSENPNMVVSEGSYTVTLTTTFAGQSETEDIELDSFISDGTWSLNNKILSVTTSGVTQEATIVSQTDTTLVVKVEVEEIDEADGVRVQTNVQGVYTLTKNP
jgi:Lipocalin-like domain